MYFTKSEEISKHSPAILTRGSKSSEHIRRPRGSRHTQTSLFYNVKTIAKPWFFQNCKISQKLHKKIVLAIFKFGSKLVKRYPKITFSLFSKLPKNYIKITFYIRKCTAKRCIRVFIRYFLCNLIQFWKWPKLFFLSNFWLILQFWKNHG